MAESSTTNQAVIARTERGYFAKGVSGNPQGRPTLPKDVRDLLEAAAPKAVRKLIELIDSDDPKVAAACSTAVLDRLYGRPAQAIDANVTKVEAIGVLHLKALEDIARRREMRLAEERAATATIINVEQN